MPNIGTIRSYCEKPKCRRIEVKTIPFCVNPKRTEERRTEPTYSRYVDVKLSLKHYKERDFKTISCLQHGFDPDINKRFQSSIIGGVQSLQRNKLAPFKTLGKPTCGFNFSRETDNRKKKFGIMPSNLVKWRSEKIEKIVN